MATILEHEIFEQQAALRRLIDAELRPLQELTRRLRPEFDSVLIAARGSSDNAARYAQYLLGMRNHLPVALAAPSLFTLYASPPHYRRTLVLAISQSGRSPDILAVVEEARRQGNPTLALTNDPHSPLAQAAQAVLALHAGPEKAVAATKTYTCSLFALALLSATLGEDEADLDALRRVPAWVGEAAHLMEGALARVERYRYIDRCAVIGRGYNYSTAFEIALKVKELCQIAAEPYSSADFRHGPIATARDGFPVLLVDPQGKASADLEELAADLQANGAEVIAISDRPERYASAEVHLQLPVGVPEWLSPLVAVVPGQFFALRLAEAKHLDPDHPAELHKVTETY
jgi:glucosamine--fructose-6-phosphate aminotransferase (isomerizing)